MLCLITEFSADQQHACLVYYQKADEMCKAVPPLRKYLGYEATVGLPELINTDWVSSEWSAAECNPGAEERTRLRKAQDAPEGSWEIQTRLWVEPQVRRIQRQHHSLCV